MSEILFKSYCPEPLCNDKTIIIWYHATCSPYSKEFINDNGEIKCEECGEKWNFFMTRFDCATHSNNFGRPRSKRALYCFNEMFKANEISEGFYRNIIKNIERQAEEYGVNYK
jgi:hypothetical protein